MKVRSVTLALLLGAATMTGSTALAAEGDTEIENRKNVMAVAGASFKTIACAMKGKCSQDDKFLGLQARALAYSAHLATYAFGKGPFENATVKTTAKPDIWDDWDTFREGLDGMRKGALEMMAAAEVGDDAAFKKAFTKTGKTCKNCHDNFRQKD